MLAPSNDPRAIGPSPNRRSRTTLQNLIRPLSRSLSLDLARALIGIRADAETQARYDELADQRTEGRLTADEQLELESMVRANTLLTVLKAEARAFLAHADQG